MTIPYSMNLAQVVLQMLVGILRRCQYEGAEGNGSISASLMGSCLTAIGDQPQRLISSQIVCLMLILYSSPH